MRIIVAASLGTAFGLLVSMLAVSVFLVPPAFLQRWAFHPEPLHARIERALNADEQLNAIRDKERKASEKLKKAIAELAGANRRLEEAESALNKARDEITAVTSNLMRGIRIKSLNSSRHANGTIYIGVRYAAAANGWCEMSASSDRMDKVDTDVIKYLQPGEAVTIRSSRGKYRVVLTALDRDACTFDLVED